MGGSINYAKAAALKTRAVLPAGSLVLAAAVPFTGCGFIEPFEAPEVVAGGRNSVTLRTGSLRGAESAARQHCAQYGKRAQLNTYSKMKQRAVSLYLYDCVVSDDRGS